MARPEVTGCKSSPTESTENRDAYSIDEFCRRHGISHGTYYNLRTLGLGPREGRAMKRVLISKESAADWRKGLETPTDQTLKDESRVIVGTVDAVR